MSALKLKSLEDRLSQDLQHSPRKMSYNICLYEKKANKNNK